MSICMGSIIIEMPYYDESMKSMMKKRVQRLQFVMSLL